MRLRVGINTHNFGRFWSVSWTTTHRFVVTKRFLLLSNPKVCLRVGGQDSQSRPILARFVDYYSLFCGPRVISTIDELNPEVRLSVGDQHSWFLSILTRFGGYYHCFGVPKRFPWLLNPKVLLRVGHQQSRFSPIMARFMDYYSLISSP